MPTESTANNRFQMDDDCQLQRHPAVQRGRPLSAPSLGPGSGRPRRSTLPCAFNGNSAEHDEGRRDHVGGHAFLHVCAERSGRRTPRLVLGHNMQPVACPPGRGPCHDAHLGDARASPQHRLNLFSLDPEATDLDLVVPSAFERYDSIGSIPCHVARAVQDPESSPTDDPGRIVPW